MTFFSIMFGGESPESTGKSSLCGNYFFPPLYYIDIHLLQSLIIIRRIINLIEMEGITKKYFVSNIRRTLKIKDDVFTEALAELDTSNLIKFLNKQKRLVH